MVAETAKRLINVSMSVDNSMTSGPELEKLTLKRIFKDFKVAIVHNGKIELTRSEEFKRSALRWFR